MAFWVYILRCSDGRYYTGQTDDLEKRVAEHTSGAIPDCYTFTRRPVKLVFSNDFPTREEALVSERQIKGWSRKKKEAMMHGDWAEVSRLARSSVQAETTDTVRAEPVEVQIVTEQDPLRPIRPLRQAQGQGQGEQTTTSRDESTQTLRAKPTDTVQAEPVEALSRQNKSPLRLAQGERK